MGGNTSLRTYRAKRDFARTPEPGGRAAPARARAPRFVIQQHAATRLHYDFRLEADGVLKSWAVPKGPSNDPRNKRLAMRTEDHPLGYLEFEGVIPQGQYGAGAVIVWDIGTYRNLSVDSAGRQVPVSRAIERGKVEIWLEGSKARGAFVLVRTRPGRQGREQWLLIKKRDQFSLQRQEAAASRSVLSRRTLEDLAAESGDQFARKRVRAARSIERSYRAGSVGPPSVAASSSAPRRRAAQPPWAAPMLATLEDADQFFASLEREPRATRQWVIERKLDGFRALAFRDGPNARLLSRNQNTLGDKYPEVLEALRRQPVDQFIIDGEIVAFDARRISFERLQQRLKPITLEQALRSTVRIGFVVFDLLFALGIDTRELPLIERKKLLKSALRFEPPLYYSNHHALRGRRDLAGACAKGWEGLIAKRRDAPYAGRRSTDWVKLKCSNRQEFVIGGYTDPQGSRTAFGAVLVGYYDDGRLRYAGKVGTGFTQGRLRELHAQLRAMTLPEAPFAPDPQLPRRGVHWARPTLVAEVAFSEWTSGGKLRHPRFMGLRTDKPPSAVKRERPVRPA